MAFLLGINLIYNLPYHICHNQLYQIFQMFHFQVSSLQYLDANMDKMEPQLASLVAMGTLELECLVPICNQVVVGILQEMGLDKLVVMV